MERPLPKQILAVGRNYAAHAAELGHTVSLKTPLLFWKPVGSVCADNLCRLPSWAEGPSRVDYEGEVALVLDRDLGPGTGALPDDPWDAVAGVAAAVDITDRDMQKREPQWVRAKGFAGACALAVAVPRPPDPDNLRLGTWHNDQLVQRGHTGELLFPFRDLLVYLHGWCRLFAGDVILTGTPEGVGPVAPGDTVRVQVSAGGGGTVPISIVEVSFLKGPQVAPFTRAERSGEVPPALPQAETP
jgi:2-keto-4-pentenoate hydratase/2-oxohepta-3-ene-1,7-dioic acid hydratase in catechol pathway